jgi:hypothetical protein
VFFHNLFLGRIGSFLGLNGMDAGGGGTGERMRMEVRNKAMEHEGVIQVPDMWLIFSVVAFVLFMALGVIFFIRVLHKRMNGEAR